MTKERWSSAKVLRERGLAPKKSFGQNFLQDAAIADRIAELATTPVGGTVVEIGAGAGALTAPLAARAHRVVAIERDRDLVPVLAELFHDSPNVEVLEADAAQVDWARHFAEGPRPHVLAGNLPYQITGRLLELAVHASRALDRAVFMVQREVADRLVARPGEDDYGALSVFTQAAFHVERALKVPPGAFFPAPSVDSAVVTLTPLAPPRAEETEAFRELVRRAFAQRRKTLRNAWKGVFGWRLEELDEAAAAARVDLTVRGETLAVEDFARMATLDRAGLPRSST
ncbi:MAG: ribosomal RNA small subunit methyltransferase A [Deltaproteobacteria bacterium]|nr:ribosomal RNA small subunit methyltransferase A [Deltaproteobacteria bacterium]